MLFIEEGNQVPEIKLVESIGKIGTAAPEQKGAITLKIGVTLGATVTVKVVVDKAQSPVVGIKVYVPVNVLLTIEDQVPVIAGVFVELVGKTGAVAPEQIAGIVPKVGVTLGATVTVKVVVAKAQNPAVGIKVYVPVAVLLTTDDQVPVIAGVFVELVGKTGTVAPEQIAGIVAKIGVTLGVTVTIKVVVDKAQSPIVGVKVYVPVAVLLTTDDQVPVIAGVFVELVGKTGAVAPEQITGIVPKVGVTLGETVTVKVVVDNAQSPAVGVKVYVPVAVLLTNEDQVPVIAGIFVELVGKTGAIAPEQIAGIVPKVGVTLGVTVTVKVLFDKAQNPETGEKVYVPVKVLLTAGDQVPVIAGVFIELVGKTGAVVPEQIAETAVKVGVTLGVTVTVKVVVAKAQSPAVGVKVYVPVDVLLTADDQVPVIAGVFVELVGKTGDAAPEQIAETAAKVGVTLGETVTVKVVDIAHCPEFGVKVYVPVAVLFTAGDHDPRIKSSDTLGKIGEIPPEQIE